MKLNFPANRHYLQNWYWPSQLIYNTERPLLWATKTIFSRRDAESQSKDEERDLAFWLSLRLCVSARDMNSKAPETLAAPTSADSSS